MKEIKVVENNIEYTVKVYDNGDKYWFLNDKRHRKDGPAFEFASGNKSWYLNGKRHREDGPAIEYADGHKEWWYQGEPIKVNNNEEFLRLMKIKAFL